MPRPQLPNSDRTRLLAELTADPPIFETATFKAFMNRNGLKFLHTGDMAVTFTIPSTSVEAALALRQLCANPLPLTILVKVDDEYADDVTATEIRLASL